MRFTIEGIEDVKLASPGLHQRDQSADGADQIEILCETDHAHLRVTVANRRGTGIAIAPPALADDEVRIDGLGVFLIRSLMDDVEYDADQELGTRLVMIKRLAS